MSRRFSAELDDEEARRNLNPEFIDEGKVVPERRFGNSTRVGDPELKRFKLLLEREHGSIESIKRVLGKPEVIVACLAIGTCVLYKIVNGILLPFFSGGKSRRKRHNKKRTLRRKYK
jgi:hypothetical protein